ILFSSALQPSEEMRTSFCRSTTASLYHVYVSERFSPYLAFFGHCRCRCRRRQPFAIAKKKNSTTNSSAGVCGSICILVTYADCARGDGYHSTTALAPGHAHM